MRRRGLDLSFLGERPVLLWTVGVLAIAAIGAFDYASGTELRTYPLYFVPVALLAWHAGLRGCVAASLLSTIGWTASNLLAGMRFSSDTIWVANAALHASAFLFVGYLLARLRSAVDRLRSQSRTDALTRLRNSRAFYDEAPPLLSLCARRARPVTLAYLDLDNFKSVNDELGHRAGDDMLRRVADKLRESLRPSDLCARLGGDEFAILFPDLDADAAITTLERIRTGVAAAAHSPTRAVSVSIGAVTFVSGPFDLEQMIQQADALMYQTKAAGRNRVKVDAVLSAQDGGRPERVAV